jgi:transcriptional regulator with XRE-family HTH domain
VGSAKEYKQVGAGGSERDRAGLTQAQLAKLLRKPQSFVSSYERGQRRMDVPELLRIVDVLEGSARAVLSNIIGRRAGEWIWQSLVAVCVLMT